MSPRHHRPARALALALLLPACGSRTPTVDVPSGGSAATSTATLAPPPAAASAEVEEAKRTLPARDHRGPIEVRTPRIVVPGNPSATAAIQSTLADFLAVGEDDVRVDFRVSFNARGFLDLTVVHETVTAYPDQHEEHYLFELRSGRRLHAADVFRTDKRAELVAAVDAKMQEAIRAAGLDTPDCADLKQEPRRFSADRLREVRLEPQALTVLYDFDFPHVIQACEPSGEFRFTAAELEPYLASGTGIAEALAK
jgi:hypothetical protein